MPKMFSANPRVSRTANSKISSSSNNTTTTRSMRLSQLSKSSKLSVNRTLANTFGPTDIFLSSITIPINMQVGTEIGRISSKDVNSFSFVYTLSDTSLFYIQDDKVYTNVIFTDRSYAGHNVNITSDDGKYKFSKNLFLLFQQPPVVANVISPIIMNFDTNATIIDITNVFFDVNGDITNIIASVDNNVLSVNLNGYLLTITHNSISGISNILLTAYDKFNEQVTTNFAVVLLSPTSQANISFNVLPDTLPTPIGSVIELDNTYVTIVVDNFDNLTEQDKRQMVKSNTNSILNKYATTLTSNTSFDLYIDINQLPFPPLASNVDKVRLINGLTSTIENPINVNISDSVENSALYVNTQIGNKIILTLSNDTTSIEQVGYNTFNVSVNDGISEVKNSGDFVTIPNSGQVIILSSVIIAENHPPLAYDINYSFSEDSIQNAIDLSGYDVDINNNSPNSIRYIIESLPSHGTLDVFGNTDYTSKQIKYTPFENYFGSDSFSYYVKDNYDIISNTATAGINVINVDDPAIGTITIIGNIEEGGILQYITAITDIDGELTFDYQWQISDNNTVWINIENATGSTYNIPDDQSLVDKYIRVTTTSTDSQGGITVISSQSSLILNVDDPATGTLSMTGTVEEGGELSYSSTINDVDGTITFTYQWQVSDDDTVWNNIVDATGASYNIPSDQSLVDKYIRITAVTMDSRGGTTNFVSQSSQVLNVNDQTIGQLDISGVVMESLTISADTSNITDEDGELTYTYQWELSTDDSSWSNIQGETNKSYAIPKDQGYVDKYLRVTSVSSDPNNNTVTHTSLSNIILIFNDPPVDIQISASGIYEGYEIGKEIATLTTDDLDSTEFTYSVDDSKFSIDNDKLLSNYTFAYGPNNTYIINITSTDETNNSFTKSFNISVQRLWEYTILSDTTVAIGDNTSNLANGTVLGTNLTGSIIIPSTVYDNGNIYTVTNIYQNAFTGSNTEKIVFSGDTTYTLDIPLKQHFQVTQVEEDYVLHQLEEV